MLDATDTLKAEIESHAQAPRYAVAVDFDRTGTGQDISKYVTGITTERSLTTDLPEETRLAVGYSAAQATVNLGGDPANFDHDGAWTWAPTNTESPFYGKKRVEAPVTVALGYESSAGAETLPRFTGYVSDLDTDGAARTAEITTLDPSDRLRVQVELPMHTVQGVPGLDGRYFIDYILTQNGIDPADCDLEPSLNPLTATPYVAGKVAAWPLLQTIAAAEFAVVFFDETGKFHFWNREHFSRQDVDYTNWTVTVNGVTNEIPTVTTDRDLKTLSFAESVSSVKNDIQVAYTTYQIQPFDWVWQSGDAIRLGIRQTRVIWADFDNPAINVSKTVQWIGRGFSVSGNHSGYRASRRQDGTGAAVTNLQFTVETFAQRAKITITNPNPYYCYLVSPKKKGSDVYDDDVVGEAMLWLRGQAVVNTSSDTTTTDGSTGATIQRTSTASSDVYGVQTLQVDGQNWIQDSLRAERMASDLLGLLGHPMPTLADVDVVANPRLQLGDRIRLQDKTGTMLDDEFWIVGITDNFGTDGYTQTLTLRMTAGIGSWVLGRPGRTELGETTILGGVY